VIEVKVNVADLFDVTLVRVEASCCRAVERKTHFLADNF
jgi:hypothetical protein